VDKGRSHGPHCENQVAPDDASAIRADVSTSTGLLVMRARVDPIRAYRTGTPFVRNFCARAVRGMRRPSPPDLPVPAGWKVGTSWCLPEPMRSARPMRFKVRLSHRKNLSAKSCVWICV
jgi:hypothetical protein